MSSKACYVYQISCFRIFKKVEVSLSFYTSVQVIAVLLEQNYSPNVHRDMVNLTLVPEVFCSLVYRYAARGITCKTPINKKPAQ
jgi:hypothetical protein